MTNASKHACQKSLFKLGGFTTIHQVSLLFQLPSDQHSAALFLFFYIVCLLAVMTCHFVCEVYVYCVEIINRFKFCITTVTHILKVV